MVRLTLGLILIILGLVGGLYQRQIQPLPMPIYLYQAPAPDPIDGRYHPAEVWRRLPRRASSSPILEIDGHT